MSLLQFLGVGQVAATKDTNTNDIMVYLPSMFPHAEGRVAAKVEQVERKSKNAFGEDVSSNTLKSNAIPATWKRMDDSNRITSPDVREGTPVAIYTVQGGNTYYWTLDGVNPNTFRMESVMWGWSANPNLDANADFNVDNFYVMKVDTRTGIMTARTSMANGEPTRFDVILDGQNGTISWAGNEGSYLKFDDMERSFTYTNRDGAVFNIVKQICNLYLPDKFNLFADNEVNIKTKTLRIQAQEAFIDILLTKWKGDKEHTGNTQQVGNYKQEGNFDQTGMYTHTGDVDRTGNTVSTGTVIGLTDVRTAVISLNLHIHAGVENGDGVTSTPLP